MSKSIGIKLADGTFYPILEEGVPAKKRMELTTVKDNQETVQVDLYRSENGSMEDAEYVDSLQIENLIAHPNGEPSLAFEISLDEENKLSAQICDPESGGKSNISITLVTRNENERESPANFELNSADFVETNEMPVSTEELNMSVPELSDSADEVPDVVDSSLSDDFALPPEMADISSDFDGLENDESTNEVNGSSEVPVDFSVEDSQAQNEKTFGDDMFSEDFSESKPKGLLAAASAMKENKDLPEVQSVDLPVIDFNETVPLEAENDTASSDAFKAFDDEKTGLFDLPDFDSIDLSDTPTEQTFSAEAGEELAKKALGSDELASMDFDSLSDNAGNSYDFSDSFSVGGTDFSSDSSADGKDSYDFSVFDDEKDKDREYSGCEENSKKTKRAAVICVICAVICIVMTLLFLFVIPTKLNLAKAKSGEKALPVSESPALVIEPEEAEEKPVEKEIPVPEEKLVIVPAKENQIVVAPVEQIVPTVPVAKTSVKKENIQYKIRWGDTLWDISDAYYRTPWKYSKIANYNRIRNPDYIISGTTIIIPAE